MSSIDQYKHKRVGEIECPSDYDIVYGSSIRKLQIYQLLESVPASEPDFDGKAGDFIVGGGSGEVEALRISYPEAYNFFKNEDWDDFTKRDELYKHYWSPSLSFKLGGGFTKIGWDPEEPLENWLAERVIDLLLGAGVIKVGVDS